MKKQKNIRGFQVVENECIWMKAGIVNLRTCDMAYDCFDCKFDKAMTKAMGSKTNNGNTWSDSLKEKYDGASRPCRHVLTGRIQTPKICTHSYECHNCAFDQMLDNIEISDTCTGPQYQTAAGYDIAMDYYYHKGHTWVRVEHGGRARIGFDDFIMRMFGKARLTQNFLNIGSRIKKGDPGWSLGQDNHEAKVQAPISGTILAVNQRVREDGNIMHQDPYKDGWLFIVEPDAPKKELKTLAFGEDGISFIEKENKKLIKLLGPEYQNLAATGGEPVRDFYGQNPQIGWDNLVTTFLRTKMTEPAKE